MRDIPAAEAEKSKSAIIAEIEEEEHQRQKIIIARTAELKAAKEKIKRQRCSDLQAAEAAATRIAKDRATKMQLPQDVRMKRLGQAPVILYITGSWDNWIPHEMVYNKVDHCCYCTIQLGKTGCESFNILMDGDQMKCLYPDEADASFHSNSSLCGPDENGKGRSWSVGKHQLDNGAQGVFYEIKLHMHADGNPKSIDWVRLGKFAEVPARKYWIIGTWDEWEPHEMSWDPKHLCFRYSAQLGVKGKESFQLLVNGDWAKRLYPANYESFHDGNCICGPDASGHGVYWTIGSHKFDAGKEGACYEVRLRLNTDGDFLDVHWVKLDADKLSLTQSVGKDADEALRQYLKRVAEQIDDVPAWSDEHVVDLKPESPRGAFSDMISCFDEDECKPLAGEGVTKAAQLTHEGEQLPEWDECKVRQDLEHDLAQGARHLAKRNHNSMEKIDSDGEKVLICSHCGLPLGIFGYSSKGASRTQRVHGECAAQRILDDLRDDDKRRLQADAAMKKKKREEYDIGWKADQIPANTGMAASLKCSPVPQGMCCVVLDKSSNKVIVAPTVEPAAAVNLAYLSVALQVRLREGREPLFSLDPIFTDHKLHDTSLPEIWMQEKRFVPAWLAGTRVGEVMFQADYHLKELSMGEYDQPVLGMRNCHDFSEGDYYKEGWHAREWFVIKKAGINFTEDGVLLPNVKMGVEARELDSLGKDKKITRLNHPMVKYAEQFSKNFDLIAERKSVIFNLREFARATVLAKFLIDLRVEMDECWFSLAEEEMAHCTMEIPQLWNECARQKLTVKDGKVSASDSLLVNRMHGIYGGVQFGVDRMPMTRATRVTKRMGGLPAPKMPSFAQRGPPLQASVGSIPAKPVSAPTARAVPTQPRLLAGALPPPTMAASGMAPALMGAALSAQAMPQGVDLDLGRFDLTAASLSGLEKPIADASLVIGKAFWTTIDGDLSSGMLKDDNLKLIQDDDLKLMKGIFHPVMSDRREEGDHFIPPVTTSSYMQCLRESLLEEENLRQKRKDHFFSLEFSQHGFSELFPFSWKEQFAIDRENSPAPSIGKLDARPDYKAQAAVIQQHLKSASPTFDKLTEDGLRFRIYNIGSLEVRTTQPHDGEEIIGAVFSMRSLKSASPKDREVHSILDSEQIVKVTTYVENAVRTAAGSALLDCHYYVVIHTLAGNQIVTEKLGDGSVLFNENPANVDGRNSLAKVIQAKDCNESGVPVLVQDMKKFAETHDKKSPASHSECKRYARDVGSRANGEIARVPAKKYMNSMRSAPWLKKSTH